MKGCFIGGENIYLRPFIEADIKIWYQWFNDKEVTFFMDKRRFPNTPEAQLEFLKKINSSKNDIQLAVVYKKNDRLIGTIGLHQIDFINRNADISIVIGDKNYWKKGLGKEAVLLIVNHAFNTLNLHRVTAGANKDNVASYSLFTAVGFKKEGLLKEHLYIHGKYRDVIKLGLLRTGFKK